MVDRSSSHAAAASPLGDAAPWTAVPPWSAGEAPLPPRQAASWDAFVAGAAGDAIAQTSAWAAAKQAIGFEAERVVLADGEEVVGGAQLIIRRFGRLAAAGLVPRGPILRRLDRASIETVVERIEATARAARLSLLVVQPPEGGEPVDAVLEARGYLLGAPSLAPTATVRLDLRRGLDALLADMTTTRRRYIRKATIDIREGTAVDIATFHALHAATAARQGFVPVSLDYLQGQWSALAGRGWLRLLLAELDGRAVAGIWLTAFGDTVTYRLAGWDGSGKERNPNDACHWHAIQWAKAGGYRYYDLGGIDRRFAKALLDGGSPSAALLHSPANFKRQFGGQIVLLPMPRLKMMAPMARPFARLALAAMQRSRWATALVGRLRAG